MTTELFSFLAPESKSSRQKLFWETLKRALNQFLWNVFTKVEMPHDIRLIENFRTRRCCECDTDAMIVYHKPPDFASNFYQQVSFLVTDAFLSISGNALRFDAKCVVS